MQEVLREELTQVHRFINAPLGDSMKQSLVRTVLRGMSLVTDREKKLVIASSIQEALDQTIAARSLEAPPRSVLERVVDEMFALAGVVRPRS